MTGVVKIYPVECILSSLAVYFVSFFLVLFCITTFLFSICPLKFYYHLSLVCMTPRTLDCNGHP